MGVWIMIGAIVSLGIAALVVRALSVRDRAKILVIFAIGLSIGMWRYAVAGPGANSVANVVGRSAIVEGRVIAKDLTDDGVAYVVDNVTVDNASRDDRVRLEAPISSDAPIGKYLRTSCTLEQPQAFDGFAYDRFLAAISIYAICTASSAPFVVTPDADSPHSWGVGGASDRFWLMIGSIHESIDARARSVLPEPQAALLLGLLIGENDFSSAWKQKFQMTGTSHIVAASGYNVAVVSELVLILLVSLGLYRRQAYPIVVASIMLFAVLAGAGGAVIRAVIMGILALTARHVGRKTTMRNVIALTVVLLLMIEPRLLRDDVGFQLSVMATIGLIVGTDRISALLKIIPTTFGLRESLSSTIAATIATLPITMFSFGQLSIVAPFVNIMILPFIPYAMVFGGFAIAASSIVHQLSVWVALPVWTILTTMTLIVDVWSKLPFATVTVDPRVALVLTVLLFGTITRVFRKLPRSFERNLDSFDRRRVLMIGGVLLALFVMHCSIIAWRSGRLSGASTHVFVFDVGQGDGILIDGVDKDVVIDGGPTRFGLLEEMALVRFPWERYVDVVIATHPHADHLIGLLGLIENYDIDEILDDGSIYNAPAAEAFRNSLSLAGEGRGEVCDVRVATTGDSWPLSPDASFEILWPQDEATDIAAANVHERSIVAKLTAGERTMLFTGDAEADVEAKLGDIGHIDILKVGHHGSDTSSSQKFLETIAPNTAVISVGAGNSYGHPSLFTLGRLESIEAEILRTDQRGTIRFDF